MIDAHIPLDQFSDEQIAEISSRRIRRPANPPKYVEFLFS